MHAASRRDCCHVRGEDVMETTKKLACLGSLTACLIAPTVALAENCTGHYSNTTLSAETIEIDKGYTLTFFHARGNATSENSALNGVGMCGGYALTTPDGKTKLAGICTRKGKNGGTKSPEPVTTRGWWAPKAGGRARSTMTRPTWVIGEAIASRLTRVEHEHSTPVRSTWTGALGLPFCFAAKK
jgi:hypothetical protein